MIHYKTICCRRHIHKLSSRNKCDVFWRSNNAILVLVSTSFFQSKVYADTNVPINFPKELSCSKVNHVLYVCFMLRKCTLRVREWMSMTHVGYVNCTFLDVFELIIASIMGKFFFFYTFLKTESCLISWFNWFMSLLKKRLMTYKQLCRLHLKTNVAVIIYYFVLVGPSRASRVRASLRPIMYNLNWTHCDFDAPLLQKWLLLKQILWHRFSHVCCFSLVRAYALFKLTDAWNNETYTLV